MADSAQVGHVGEHETIRNASEHRRLLLDAMTALVEGRMNVGQANALSGLSAEVHKSLKLQWDMLVYAADHLTLGPGNQLKRIEEARDDDHE